MLFQGIGDIFEAEVAKDSLRKAAHAVRKVVHARVACHGRYILVSLFHMGG